MDQQQAELIEHVQGVSPNYTDFVFVGDSLRCLAPFIYTHAILAELDEFGYARRWCYGNYDQAKAALDDWVANGGEEPTGWFRRAH